MGIQRLVKAAEAAGYAMAPIEDAEEQFDGDFKLTSEYVKGEEVARGARKPKDGNLAQSTSLVVVAPISAKPMRGANFGATGLQALRQAVIGFVGGRRATA